MRTTLMLDDDVLTAARALAEQQQRTIGEIVSELARQSLISRFEASGRGRSGNAERNGVPLLHVSDARVQVTLEMVNELRDEVA